MQYYYICSQQELLDNEYVVRTTVDDMIEDLTANPIIKGNNKMINADTETEGAFDFTNKLLSLQLGNTANAYFIAIQYLSSNDLIKLTDWLNNSTYIFIFHHAKFDYKFLTSINVYLKNVYCTYVVEMYIHSAAEMEKGFYSLKGLCKRYFDVDLNKEVRGKINHASINDTEVIYYALDDIKYLDKIVDKQVGILLHYNHLHQQLNIHDILDKNTILGLENRLIPALCEAELYGISMDNTAYVELQNQFKPLYEELLLKIKEVVFNCTILKPKLITQNLFGEDYVINSKGKLFNWASSEQKLKALQYIFPEIQSTESKVLYNYLGKHPIIELLLEFNAMFKLKTSFIDVLPNYVNKVTGKVHANINQLVSTGRMSMDSPNLQQIPRKGEFGKLLRALFVADDNKVLIGGDFSSCELAIIANNSEDELWLETIAAKEDLHGILASKTFNINLNEVQTPTIFNKDITYRDVQKTIDFGLAYGMGPSKLASTMKVTTDIASNTINTFFSIVPKVKKYLSTSGKFAVKNGYSVTNIPYNRIRKFNNMSKGAVERAGKNAPIQGTSADITKRAIVEAYEYKLRSPEFSEVKLVLFVHDEIITSAPIYIADKWQEMQKQIMLDAAKISVPLIQIGVDIKQMSKWKK